MVRNVFIYWGGAEYSLIKVLQDLIYLHSTNGVGYKVNLITPLNITKYIPNIPEYFNSLGYAHQADFIRVCVLCSYGGIWLDSDTMVLDSLDSLFDILDSRSGFFIRENNTVLCNGVFGSNRKTPLMIEWKRRILSRLATNTSIQWSEIGCQMLNKIHSSKPELYEHYKIFNGLDTVYPVNWDNCVQEFIEKPYENYKTIIREYQPFLVLVNSVYKKLAHLSTSEIENGDLPLNYFIKQSFQNIGSRVEKITNQQTFEDIYNNKIWNDGHDNIPLSGPGSSLANSLKCSQLLDTFIYEHNCKSVLDLGCGDLNWITKSHFFNDTSFEYTGVDVVSTLIHIHSKTYPNKTFICKDLVKWNDIGFQSIIILRDVIFHLKNNEIRKIFRNIKHKFDYLLITNCLNNTNTDFFDKWRFSQRNIHMAPFNISRNYEIMINESKFNRNVYIYTHDKFYDIC